jgi:hypothetical protein
MRDRTDTLAAADGDTTSLISKITNRIEIEALERNATTPEPRPASAEAQPAGGLVEPEITRRELARIWNDNQDPNEESGDAMARLYSAGFHAGMKWQAHLAEQGAAPAAEAQPAASEIFPVEYADANGEGIRIIMEPAEETGQVCWVVRNSRRVCPIREFPTPEAAYAAHQARAEDEGNHD